jgi:hypothetical protein
MEERRAANQLERLERRLEQCWRNLALAEQRGQPAHRLERMYAAYLRQLDAYVRAQREEIGIEARTRLAS